MVPIIKGIWHLWVIFFILSPLSDIDFRLNDNNAFEQPVSPSTGPPTQVQNEYSVNHIGATTLP